MSFPLIILYLGYNKVSRRCLVLGTLVSIVANPVLLMVESDDRIPYNLCMLKEMIRDQLEHILYMENSNHHDACAKSVVMITGGRWGGGGWVVE